MIPKGLEASATNSLRALSAFNAILSSMISERELTYFGVKAGYYERIKTPLMINLLYGVIIIAVSSLFLMGKREMRTEDVE